MSARPTCVFLLVASSSLFAALLGQKVSGPASVLRGRQVDLRPFLPLPANDSCTVRLVTREGISCGLVEPSVFECAYRGNVTYQHLGCFSDSVQVDFQVQSQEQSTSFLSIEIQVRPYNASAANVFLVATKPTQGSTIPFRVVFPVNIMRCYYTVVQNLWFPLAGKVVDASQQLIPCGFAPAQSLAYEQFNNSLGSDYIPLRIVRCTSAQPEIVYALATLKFEAAPPPVPASYLPALLTVRQLAATVLQPDVQIGAPPRKLVYKIAANKQLGAFASFPPRQGEGSNVTAFTEADLLAGNVAFWPLSDNTKLRYGYTLLDFAGSVQSSQSSGSIVVTSEQRSWSQPSLRQNDGLVVVSGGSVVVGRPAIDFYYVLSDLNGITVRLVQAPKHGCFHLMNTSCPTSTVYLPLISFLNGSLLYTHFASSKERVDTSVWAVACLSCTTFQVFIPIRVIQATVTPPAPLSPTSLTAYRGYAMPVDIPSLILASPAIAARGNSNVTVVTLNGTVVRIPPPFLFQINSTSDLFPYISATLLPSKAVPFINLTDIISINCWYIPLPTATGDQIVLSVGSWAYTLSVVVSDEPLAAAFVPSSAQPVPSITVNRPLPVSSDLMTFITQKFLQATGDSDRDNIVFEVSTAPRYGKLCILSTAAICGQSVMQFTQRHIDSNSLYYSPQGAINDTFQFSVHFTGTSSQQQYTFHVMSVTVGNQPLQFWVAPGKRKVITYSYFKQYCPSSPPHSLFFIVTEGPRHGYLNPTASFTQLQLLYKNVTYTHNSSKKCSDSFHFTVTSRSQTCNASGTFVISIRTLDPNGDNNDFIGPTELTIKGVTKFPLLPSYFNIYSSFCLSFIDITITKSPLRGLLLMNSTRLGTLVALGVNSSAFSYKVVSRGLLQYTLVPATVSSDPDSVSDSFDYTVADPMTRTLLSPQDLRSVPLNTPPHFNIIIDLSCMSNCTVTLNSPKLLTNLSDGRFGTVFAASDIVVAGITDSQFRNVSLQLVMPPKFGTLNKFIFTLQDLKDGVVVYSGPLQTFGDAPLKMTDSFSFSVIWTTAVNPLFLATRNTFYLQWCIMYFDPGQNLEVKESDGKIILVVRRNGPGSGSCISPSTVMISFTVINATAAINCSNAKGADFCGQPLLLSFSQGSDKMVATTQVYDNHVPQPPRQLVATLTAPTGSALDNTRSEAVVTISDPEDFASVGFTPPTTLFVPEAMGVLRLNLSRVGDLGQEVRVICYTEDWTALGGVNFQGRPNSAASAVVFPPNVTNSSCDVVLFDNQQDLPNVAFRVGLGTLSGNAVVTQGSAVVYIMQDKNNLPAVFFDKDSLVVAEGDDGSVNKAYFTISRNRSSTFPTTVYLSVLTKPQDTAQEGVDFYLANKSNVMGGDTLLLSIIILNNSLVPGNKVFHIQIAGADNGRVVAPSVLTVTILDTNTPALVEFESAVFHLVEGINQFATIPLVRTGNPLVDPHVLCLFKAGNLSDDLSKHIFVSPEPQEVQFGNASLSGCSVYIFNSTNRTGPWTFLIVIEAAGKHAVIGGLAQATVIVDDPENIPRIQFDPSNYYQVIEPLSNWEVDKTTLVFNLTTAGDPRYTTQVTYYTADGTGIQNVNYAPTSNSNSLGSNTSPFVLVSVDILADHTSDSDHTFFLVAVYNSTFLTEVYYSNITATAVVRNREPSGVYFPALPIVTALSNLTNQTTSRALACLTPCDKEYGREDYIEECARQDVASSYAAFTWEASYDGAAHFIQLSLDTVLTSARAQVLEEVYLGGVTHVRCSVVAVSSAHTVGTARTSLYFDLSQSLKPTCADTAMLTPSVSLSTYSTYSNSSYDLILLSVTLPSSNYSVPVVSSRPLTNMASILTYPMEWRKYSCSNLVNVKDSFLWRSPGHAHIPEPLLSRDPKSQQLYSHLSCSGWSFEVWLPLEGILVDCLATMETLQLHVAYVQVYNNTLLTLKSATLVAPLPRKRATAQVVLYDVRPSSGGGNVGLTLRPLTLSYNHTLSRVEMYLYVYLPAGQDFDAGHASLVGGANTTMSLLYRSSSSSCTTEVWYAGVPVSGEEQVNVLFSLEEAVAKRATTTTTFSLGIDTAPVQWSVPVLVQLTTLLSSNIVTQHNFTYGELIYVIVSLPQWIIPTHNASICLQDVTLCTHMCNCSSGIAVLTNGTASQNLTVTLLDTSSINSRSFSFHTGSLLKPTNMTVEWCMSVSYSLVGSGASYSGTATSILTLTSGEVASTSPVTSITSTTYILITLIVLLLIALVAMVILTGVYRCARPKSHLCAPPGPMMVLPPTSDRPRKKADPDKLQRRHSIIGCPVRERYLRKRPHDKPVPHSYPRGLGPHSGSLPDLRVLALRGESFFPHPRPRLLKKPFPKVKVLNSERHLLAAVDNRVLLERRRLRNCIVNDLGAVGTTSSSRRSDIALHAEKCIAASASTPEPGAYPLTRL